LSPFIAPRDFNPTKYKASKKYRTDYLNTHEPGRVYQVAQPGKEVTVLQRVSNVYQEVEQGSKVTLEVKGKPGYPCTFTSMDLGMFENGLTSITKEANSNGKVAVEFHGVPGTIANTNILCSSPVCSTRLKFIVFTKFKIEESENNNN